LALGHYRSRSLCFDDLSHSRSAGNELGNGRPLVRQYRPWPIHIASGLARGIDTAAHLAALELGTIAVLAGGIDNVYSPENEELHRAIAEQGLLISERAPSFSPRGKDFPRRNRLISGISLGVVRPERKQHKFWRRP
jgi:predicted Rossmann fold nucleotide-binding protein DprA/Smf involved in DNA uptake